jgi:hypothetical protein
MILWYHFLSLLHPIVVHTRFIPETYIYTARSTRSTIFPFSAGPLRTEIDRHAHRLFVYVMVDTCSSWSLEPGILLDRWHPSDIGG